MFVAAAPPAAPASQSSPECATPGARALRRAGDEHHPPPPKTRYGVGGVFGGPRTIVGWQCLQPQAAVPALTNPIRAGPVGPPANYGAMALISC